MAGPDSNPEACNIDNKDGSFESEKMELERQSIQQDPETEQLVQGWELEQGVEKAHGQEESRLENGGGLLLPCLPWPYGRCAMLIANDELRNELFKWLTFDVRDGAGNGSKDCKALVGSASTNRGSGREGNSGASPGGGGGKSGCHDWFCFKK
ncbi:hypothetical protein CRG98_011957 [Punica granatum]|uniref:Uncharacterized protein n=1 Tax=Punica granatum TaxID=22663 RepID=A0A2I0KGY0_PUNGR|nr:hypothetical protein CRG98_011957 [Punica granatum]